VPNLDRGELIPSAAGERIVAFARPGKPPGMRFFRQNEGIPTTPLPSIFRGFATFFKA
jgi:hypothetical protein